MAFDTFERMVAFRYLRARRQEGFISVIAIFSLLGIMLGVATLIIVMSVMNGFHAELLREILGFNGHLGIVSTQGGLKNFDKLASDLKGVPGIVAVYPLVEGQVLASANGRSTGVMVRGMRESDLKSEGLLASHVAPEALKQFADDKVLVGSKLASSLGLHPGDSLTLLSPNGQATAFGNVPRVKAYQVAGTFEIGMYQYDSSILFMPLPAAQLFFQKPEAVMSLRIFILSGASIGVVGTFAGFVLGIVFTTYIEQIRQFLQHVLHVTLFNEAIYFFTQIPAQIDPGEVASVLVMAFGLSFLATLYPSWRAARLDPVEALRYE